MCELEGLGVRSRSVMSMEDSNENLCVTTYEK